MKEELSALLAATCQAWVRRPGKMADPECLETLTVQGCTVEKTCGQRKRSSSASTTYWFADLDKCPTDSWRWDPSTTTKAKNTGLAFVPMPCYWSYIIDTVMCVDGMAHGIHVLVVMRCSAIGT